MFFVDIIKGLPPKNNILNLYQFNNNYINNFNEKHLINILDNYPPYKDIENKNE